MKLAKRIIALIAALVCVFGLFACGTEAVGNDEPQMIKFDHITVDADTVNEIKTAYIDYVGDDYYTTDDIEMEIYGEYNGVYVFYVVTGGQTAVAWNELIDDLVFPYSGGRTIQAYSDGEIMTLKEAYDNDVLTHDDLIDINEKRYGSILWYTDENDI